jgi:predicted dehydrogenase
MVDERVKVGFVGCGGIARGLYTPIYAELCDIAQVVAVADLVDELAENARQALADAYTAEAYRARADALGARTREERETAQKRAELATSAAEYKVRKYRDHEELLRDEEVQLVCVFTPPVIRAGPAVAAMEAGRHVYSEGPLAKSVEEADAIVAAVKKAGVKFHSQVINRYPRGMVLARRAVESGRLGEMGSANVESSWFRAQSYYSGWHGTWDGEGGGAVFHHGRYMIDPFLWVVGSRVVEVFAYSGPMLRKVEHDSLTQALVRFANGATGIIHASLIDQNPEPKLHITVYGADASMEVYRKRGAVVNTTFASASSPDAVDALEALRADVAHLPEEVTQADQTRLFLESIINDTEPLVPIEIPYHHVEVTRAIYKSAAEGMPVTLPLDKGDPFYSHEGRF